MNKKLPAEWKTVKIGDLCDVGRGSSPRPIKDPRYFDGGNIPWIKIADATSSGKYLYKTKQYVNEYGASFSRLMPKGSLIVAASGVTLGYVQLLGVDGCIHDGWLYLTNFNGVDREFLYYKFKLMGQHFHNASYGAAIQNINTPIMRELEIDLPPLPIQRKIAAVLSAYDDLIENNTRRIALLEEMAQLIYREWFVHYRFPGHESVPLVEVDGFGPAPEGWEVIKLGHVAKEIRRNRKPDEFDSETPYVGLEHIPRKSIALTDWGKADQIRSTKLAFKKNEILFGKIRPYFHKVVVAPIDGICSTDTIVIIPKKPEHFSVVLCCVSSEHFVDYATTTSQGTKMPRADWKVLVKYPLVIPPASLLCLFSELVTDIVAQIQNLVFRNHTLRQTRDLLLPRLISGAVDVSALAIDLGED